MVARRNKLAKYKGAETAKVVRNGEGGPNESVDVLGQWILCMDVAMQDETSWEAQGHCGALCGIKPNIDSTRGANK